MPHKKPLPRHEPVQLSITVLQPTWRRTEQDSVFAWQYCIPTRYWCAVRARFGAWTICGKVTLCQDKTPVLGVRVRAYDADWLQDDPLGDTLTDGAGKFRIDYTRADFERTPLSPIFNFELVGGPDLYFRVETPLGAALLVEPSSKGRTPGRENAGACFCVELCLPEAPPPNPDPFPAFTHIGGYKFLTDIHSASGGDGLTVSDNRAFYSTIRLNGIMAKKFNNQIMEYMFEVAPVSTGVYVQVALGQIAPTVIGQWEHWTGDPMNPVETQYYIMNGTPGPTVKVPIVTGDGWIQMPQESNFLTAEGFFSPNGNMINLNTVSLASFPAIDLTGLVAGNSSISTGKPLAQDKLFSIRMWVREAGNNATRTVAGTCTTVAVDNTLYDNLLHHPSWMAVSESGALAVCMLDIQELEGAGCAGIGNTLTPRFTAAHPNLGAVSISMSGPGGPYGFTLPAAVAGERFGSGTPTFVVTDLIKCAYIVTLEVQVLLTTGDSIPNDRYDQIAFCKK